MNVSTNMNKELVVHLKLNYSMECAVVSQH